MIRKNDNETPPQMFPLKIYFGVILDSALRRSHPLATFKGKVLKKISKIHGKTVVLEFTFSFLVLFFKNETSAGVFSCEIFKMFDKTVLKNSSGLLFIWLSNITQQRKTISKLAIKQPKFWYIYYDIWTCFYKFL